jgi:serine/threonine protein kinase
MLEWLPRKQGEGGLPPERLGDEGEQLLGHGEPLMSNDQSPATLPSPISTVKSPPTMSLSAGTTVGRYQIQSLLGSGGMGEVYKALDATLGRPVALKVLRRELSVDPARLSRFLHEARAASALNHPNILTIHEVGDHDASRFLVSEFVEGETVRQRLERGSLTLREILDIGIQTASALAAAHAASIVHRDIKPDNLMLRPDGYIKVLDFGVATFARPATGSTDAMVTMAAAGETSPGMIVGTIAYMSPEQARGLSVDGRSDGYSLGVVLYELVTGRAPFAAPTTSDLLVAILEREPPPLRVAARALPPPLEWIIEKALEKDPNLRYQTIADLRVDLLRLKAALESGRLTSPVPDTGGAAVDAPLERDLTDDSPEVASISRLSWISAGLGAVAIVTLTAAMSYYHRARPGADLPLQLPYGAAITKARDAIASFGYSNAGSKTDIEFRTALDVDDVTAMAGLAAAREAIREGAVAEWRVGVADSGNPDGDNQAPPPGSFSVRLSPRGQIAGFVTGTASDSGIAAADRARAIALGLDTLRRTYGIDASAYEFELIQRSFPAGTVEMTWRSPTQRFGHVEQLRVNLQGERIVLVERTFQQPRGYTKPKSSLAGRVMRLGGPIVIGGLFVAGWVFGLYVLFKTRNWDALTRPLPLAICTLVLVQVALTTIGSGALQSALSIVAMSILLVGTVLPALSGVTLWIGRRSPARLWAAEQLIRGRMLIRGVSASLFDGVSGGVVIAAVGILADWAALTLPGFVPSISREISAVEAGIGSTIGETIGGSSFIALGIALAVEALDRARLHAAVSTIIVAIGAGLVAASNQQAILPGLTLIAGMSIAAALAVWLYRSRGFLAVWTAAIVAGLVTDAMAARSLEDPALLQLSNGVLTIVFVLAIAGGWGLFKSRVRTPQPAQPAM